MNRLHRSLSLAAISFAALIAAQGGAQAGAFALREQSTEAQGMSFAGAASGSGSLSSMYWNPATMTFMPGFQTEIDGSLIIPQVEITPTFTLPAGLSALGGSGDIGQDAFLPSSYAGYQVNDRLWLGVSVSTPFGLVTKPNDPWAGQLYSRTTSVTSFDVAPTVAYRVNDWLSVGASVRGQYFKVRYFSAIGPSPDFPSPFAPSAGLEGDSFGIGYSLGATLTPAPGTTIGLGFRSGIEHDIEGDFLVAGRSVSPIKSRIVVPEIVSLGVSQQVTDAFSLHGTVEWTNWSRLGSPRVYSTLSGTLLPASPTLPLEYNDSWFFALGGEYRINPAWTVRAGIGYELAPIDVENRTTRLPDADRLVVSLGTSYNWSDQLTVDLAYTHVFAVSDTDIDIRPGHPSFRGAVFVADSESNVDIISAAVRYRWDNPTRAIPAPIVRKY